MYRRGTGRRAPRIPWVSAAVVIVVWLLVGTSGLLEPGGSNRAPATPFGPTSSSALPLSSPGSSGRLSVRPVSTGTTYYVDYARGSDASPRTSASTPWKHSPGDPDATGIPANTTLAPGDVVEFKGGAQYNGTIVLDWSGLPGQPITYDGNSQGSWGSGRAIIDGMGRARGPLAYQYGVVGGEHWNGAEDVGASYVTVEHFEIRDQRYIWNDTGGGWNNGPQGVEIGGAGSNVTVEDCWVHDVQPIAPAVNANSEVMGTLNAWSSVHVTSVAFGDANVSLAEYAGTPGTLAHYKIYVGWGSDDYTIASAYLGAYWALNNTLRVYQDLNLTMPGWNTAYSNPVGAATKYGYSIFNMTDGPMYGKQSADIAVSNHVHAVLVNNTLSDAGTGIGLSQDNDSLIEGNDISSVSWGIAGGSGEVPAAALTKVTIAFNRIHDFYPYVKYGYWSGWHGDGIYLFAGSNSYAVIENLLIEGNDYYGYIPESTALVYCEDADYVNVTIYDNIFAASGSWMIRISADPGSLLNEVRVFNNDFVMVPLDQTPAVLFQGAVTNVSLRNNVVWIPSGWGAVFSFDPAGLAPLGSDDNLLGSDYAYAGDIGYNGTEYTLAQWVGSSFSFPHDQHSLLDADPRFVNFPDFEAYLSGGTADHVTLQVEDPLVNPHVNSTFRVGDHVEYDYDGVVRTVIAVGSGSPQPWVEFTPALSAPPSVADYLTDWGNDTNYTLNLHMKATSPLIGAGVNLAGQVPAVDADGSARPLTGPWDLGAYVYEPTLPPSLSSLLVQPGSSVVDAGGAQAFLATAICTSTCPAGVSYSWSLTNSLGQLNTTTGDRVTFTARGSVGTDTLFVNASLDGVIRGSGPIEITIVAPKTTAELYDWEIVLVATSACVLAGIFLVLLWRRRKRAGPTTRSSGQQVSSRRS
jgi:Right handed beta helix region